MQNTRFLYAAAASAPSAGAHAPAPRSSNVVSVRLRPHAHTRRRATFVLPVCFVRLTARRPALSPFFPENPKKFSPFRESRTIYSAFGFPTNKMCLPKKFLKILLYTRRRFMYIDDNACGIAPPTPPRTAQTAGKCALLRHGTYVYRGLRPSADKV